MSAPPPPFAMHHNNSVEPFTDAAQLVELLEATCKPNISQKSEKTLREFSARPKFAPLLLHLVGSNETHIYVRQAGAIFLKNLILRHWYVGSNEFCIPEVDKAAVREAIIEAAFRPRPDLISNQISICISIILRHDFPNTWPQVVDKIHMYLLTPDSPDRWFGALLALYQMTKQYEYAAREPLYQAMKHVLEPMYRVMLILLSNADTDDSLLMQKLILKIYYAFVKDSLPLFIVDKQVFAQWMEVLRVETDKPVPECAPDLDDEDKMRLPIWKVKKWAVRTLHKLIYRYGSPNNGVDVYKELAEWYIVSFSAGILEVLLKILNRFRNKEFVSNKVMQHSLNYIMESINHRHSWKFLKIHMNAIIQDVIFPIMCHSEADEELFMSDPKSYLRVKTDILDELLIPQLSAKGLLIHSCKKRKGMLMSTMTFCVYVLANTDNIFTPYQRDGALHMIGSLSGVAIVRQGSMVEGMLIQYVLPEFTSPYEHMRARACWTIQCYAPIKISNQQLLDQIMRYLLDSLLKETCLPIKFDAAIGLQCYLNHNQFAKQYVLPHVHSVTLELLNLLRVTENDDLTAVIQKLLCMFTTELMPVAADITDHLANSFVQVFKDQPSTDEKAITSMALLNTISTILTVTDDKDEVFRSLQPKILIVVSHIFRSDVQDFYEEAFSMIYTLTSKFITPEMWQVMGNILFVFKRNAQEYFTEMMPVLHNYVTVDTNAFLANPNHIHAIYEMCQTILTGDYEDDTECHAAKLIEITILQCKNRIDQCIPTFIQLALKRLLRDVRSSELRVMCLQIVIAAFFYDPDLFVTTMTTEVQANIPTVGCIMTHFVSQWVTDTDCFLGIHDRRLAIIGFCYLLMLNPERRHLLGNNIPKILPSVMLLFDGLKKAYEMRDAFEEEVDSDSSSDELYKPDNYDLLSSDEDDQTYKQHKPGMIIENPNANHSLDDCDNDDDSSSVDITPLEGFTTPLEDKDCQVDEYIIFYDIMTNINETDKAFSIALADSLSEDQKKIFIDVVETAVKRRNQRGELSGAPAAPNPQILIGFIFSRAQ